MAQIPARGDCSRQLTRKQAGDVWEAAARRWLESEGLRFVAANVRERGGQCDPQQTTQIITYCPLVARPPEWEF